MANKIKYTGILELNNINIDCYVLEDGRRILSGREMQRALSMVDESEDGKQTAGTRLNRYLDQKTLKPFIYKEKGQDHFEPIVCYKGKSKINGYEATVLIDICDAFLQARKEINLSPRQKIIADQCEILVRSFAKVGLIALIDEATGYQYERESHELQKILSAYISSELLAWQQRFPHEFYKEIFRLRGWDYTASNIKTKPSVVGHWTNQLIYKQLPNGVLRELKNQTPKDEAGRRRHQYHRLLTEDIGHPHLQKQLVSIITLMNVSNTWEEFIRLFNKKFGQQALEFDEQKTIPKEEVSLSKFNKNLKTALDYNPNKDK